ncbi:hypothetical protein FJY93_05240 [Candidatus Kaiserbacteria bacterium]|nr:hypothetical protein [Candidatus Kaiserbacteria bacterium]
MDNEAGKSPNTSTQNTHDNPDTHLFSSLDRVGQEGLSDDDFSHVKKCPMCYATLVVSGYSPEALHQKWLDDAPERAAKIRFDEACEAWYPTWRGRIYLFCGGPFWSRRAKWLGIPQWKDYWPRA